MKIRSSFTRGGGPEEDLYFCIGDQCLTPRPLSQMRYKCPVCDSSMTAEGASRNRPVKCPVHHQPLIPHCPDCGRPILQDATGRPIRLVGGAHSGKTVYSAVLAYELERLSQRFSEATGIYMPRINADAYLKKTVRPLYEQGVLPTKTSESHKIVHRRLPSDGRPAEMITLHDMAGEDAPTTPIGYHSNKTLFLINPQATSTPTGVSPFGPLVRGHAFLAIEKLVERLIGMAWLDEAKEPAVQSLCNQAAVALRNQNWPNCPRWGNLADLLLEIARTALERPASAEAADRRVLAAELESTSNGLRDMPDFMSQFQAWAGAMRTTRAPVIDGRLAGHRLALVFSKADLLGDSEIWAANLEATFRISNVADAKSARTLGDALRKMSSGAENLLLELRLNDLVASVKRQVSEVGFFFVSSLGRDTEIKVTRRAPVAAQAAPGGGHQIGGATAAPAARVANTPRWELTEVLSLNPRDGTRAPTPRGVINPLLWLLLG